VKFHENYIYLAEDYFSSYEDYFCSAEELFSGRTKIFLFGYFHKHFFNSIQDYFLFVFFFHKYSVYFQKIIFIRVKIFLLVLTFFVCIFLDKIAQNLREFSILFGNIYEWSGALVKFHEDFFQHKSCVYSFLFITFCEILYEFYVM